MGLGGGVHWGLLNILEPSKEVLGAGGVGEIVIYLSTSLFIYANESIYLS